MKKRKYSRRDFLKFSALGTCGAAVHGAVSPGFNVMSYANAQALTGGKHLFVINLAGGCSYNIAPIYADAWRDKNPSVSYGAADSLPLTGGADQGFHPSLTYFKQLFDEGDLALLNQVGFSTRASRSHSTAAQMWMTGSIAPNGRNGVLNSISCGLPGSGLFTGISFAGPDPIVEGSCGEMRKLEGLSSLNGGTIRESNNGGVNNDATDWLNIQRQKISRAASAPNSSAASFVRNSIANMDASAQQIQDTLDGSNLPNVGVNPPGGGFGNDISDAMRVLQASSVLGTQIYYLETGGFDTHSNERGRLVNNLNNVNAGVRYIAEITKNLGVWNNTIIMVFTEFARTFENSAQGTDHGEVAPLFLMGGGVNGRQVNAAPTNSKIASANRFLRTPEIDTRSVWYNIISNGLGLTPTGILDSSGYSTSNLNLFT